MSTIQPLRRTITDWVPCSRLACGFVFSCALASLTSDFHLQAQEAPEGPSAETVQRGVDDDRSFDIVKITSYEMQLDLMENTSKDFEFGERILRVDGFDANTITVVPLPGGNRLRVRAEEQNVTTMTVTGESNQIYKIHIHVTGDARHLQAILREYFPNTAINCVKLVNGAVMLTGYVADTQTITQILDVANLYAPIVINHMRVGGPQEVQLRVKIFEVQRTKLRTFGMDLLGLGDNAVVASTPGGIAPLTGLINPINGAPGVTMTPSGSNLPSLTVGFNTSHFAFSAFLQILKEEGLLKFHTEPVLVTRSGEPARLADGGEFPIPVPGGLGTVTIEFREFGVTLETLPTVISPTRVRQQVNVIVSDKDTSNSITLLGTTVPGISKREVKSTIEMNFGETMVLGGLLNRRDQGTTLKTPFLGELPFIGAAFRKMVMQEAETELIVMITPEFGSSMPMDMVPPAPGMSTTVPTDRELYFKGLIEVPRWGGPGLGANCPPDGGGGIYGPGYRNDGLTSGAPSGPGMAPVPGPSLTPQRISNSGLSKSSTKGSASSASIPEDSANEQVSPKNNPREEGLIGPDGSGPSATVPPSPGNSLTRRNRSLWPSKAKIANSTKRKDANDSTETDTVQPAGFEKSPTSKK